jgi:hypothetical protein
MKYVDPDGKSDKPSLVSRVINLFKNDNSTRIQTLGVTASGTVTMVSGAIGGGVYINPRNDKLQAIATALTVNPVTAPAGILLTAINTEDAGVYGEASAGAGAGISGSVAASMGVYKGLDAAKGAYLEFGFSAGGGGISGGGDIVTDIRVSEVIGETASLGLSVGSAEVHTRAGVSGFFSVKDFLTNLFVRKPDE